MTVTRNVLPPSVTRLKTFPGNLTPQQEEILLLLLLSFYLKMQKPDQTRSSYILVVYALLMVRESIDRDQDLK